MNKTRTGRTTGRGRSSFVYNPSLDLFDSHLSKLTWCHVKSFIMSENGKKKTKGRERGTNGEEKSKGRGGEKANGKGSETE